MAQNPHIEASQCVWCLVKTPGDHSLASARAQNDALQGADELTEVDFAQHDSTSLGMDLDQALATLSSTVRLCVVLSYQAGMSHAEIAGAMELPLGTVKSHILRGTKRLQQILAAYADEPRPEKS